MPAGSGAKVVSETSEGYYGVVEERGPPMGISEQAVKNDESSNDDDHDSKPFARYER